MKDRLLEFLRVENKSSAQFAEEIGVQPSGISHILSGRNNPSLDFVLKMLEKYQFLSTEWLLFGKGSMYKDPKLQSLFDEEFEFSKDEASRAIKNETNTVEIGLQNRGNSEPDQRIISLSENSKLNVKKIVWFYDDNSFEEFIHR